MQLGLLNEILLNNNDHLVVIDKSMLFLILVAFFNLHSSAFSACSYQLITLDMKRYITYIYQSNKLPSGVIYNAKSKWSSQSWFTAITRVLTTTRRRAAPASIESGGAFLESPPKTAGGFHGKAFSHPRR